MGKRAPKERKIGMYKAILELKDLEECCNFFEDICAVTELRSMEQRFEVARMLKQEKVYTEIRQKTNASSATISRGESYDEFTVRAVWERFWTGCLMMRTKE